MGKMIFEKISQSDNLSGTELYISNRTKDKVSHLADYCTVCDSNKELASLADIVFMCVRPVDMKTVVAEIKDSLNEQTLLVSLNGSIRFEQLESVCKNKIVKVIPSVTAEVNQSQTLVCYNELVTEEDKAVLKNILQCMGNIIELPEEEMGMGSELVS
jgi:pyrroline-5-carboxylate reductase